MQQTCNDVYIKNMFSWKHPKYLYVCSGNHILCFFHSGQLLQQWCTNMQYLVGVLLGSLHNVYLVGPKVILKMSTM